MINKFILGLCCGILLSASSAVFASESIQTLLTRVTFEMNGKSIKPGDEYGILNYNGHVYVPIRFVAESFGAVIGYDVDKEKVTIKSGNQDMSIFDSKYHNITVGNLIAVKEGDQTRVTGQLQQYSTWGQLTNCIQAKLSFYNAEGATIGEAEINGDDFGREPTTFEAIGQGNFQTYASVKLDVQKVDGRVIVVDPDPDYPEVALEDIFQIDLNKVDKIEIFQVGTKTIVAREGDDVFQNVIRRMKALKLRKSVDQTLPAGYLYAIGLYIGEVKYSYSTTIHLYNNQQRNYGKFVPNESTKELDRYIDSIFN